MVHRVFIAIRNSLSIGFILFYWLIYRFILTFILFLFCLPLLKQSYLRQRFFSSYCWLMMSGLPPFTIFWLKVFILSWIIFNIGILVSSFIILTRVFALSAYYRTWHSGVLLEHRIIGVKPIGPISVLIILWTITIFCLMIFIVFTC